MRRMGRRQMIPPVIRGTCIAAGITLAAMAVLTVVVWKMDVSDGMLVLLNQVMKILSVILAVYAVVGRGGESGFLTGAWIGTLYTAVGYGVYMALGGPADVSGLLGEWMIGAAAGALSGAVTVNLPARKKT